MISPVLEDMIYEMKQYMDRINVDLDKLLRGFKSPGQRLRLKTIAFEKFAKKFRKASMTLQDETNRQGRLRKRIEMEQIQMNLEKYREKNKELR
jgi:exonuclease VII large subunit